MIRVLGQFVVVVLMITAIPYAVAQSSDPGIQQAESSLRMKLKDGASARFIDVVRVPSRSGGIGVVCGWVNARNSYGGYIGYKPFVVSSGQVMIRDESDSVFSNKTRFDDEWFGTCFPGQVRKFGSELTKLPDYDINEYCEDLSDDTMPDSASDEEKQKRSASCEQYERSSLAWLKAHTTAEWISNTCLRQVKRTDSEAYSSIRSCIEDEEADIIFQSGPPVPGAAQSQHDAQG